MINIFIAFDCDDIKLGPYFHNCMKDLSSVLLTEKDNGLKCLIMELPTRYCNWAHLDIKYSKYKDRPFIIVAYTHGNEDALTVGGTSFIKADEDNSFFNNSFFYTNSCLSGKRLGPNLIEQKCKTFIGYDQEIVAFKNELQQESLKCDNIGINLFLTSDYTAYEAFIGMKDYYTQKANSLDLFRDILSASLLINAREALVFHGDKNLKKSDLMDE